MSARIQTQKPGRRTTSPSRGPQARGTTRSSRPPATEGGRSSRNRRIALAAGLLAAVCLVAYWNSFRAELLLDNKGIILKDTRLRAADWQSIRDIFTLNYWWPTGESDLFRPLTTLSYWFNYSILGGGENPAGYHAVNLLLHWANALLVFFLVRGVTRRPWVSLVTAALFSVHPLTVESVTNIVGRADLLAALSVLGGLCLYRGYLDAARNRGSRWLAGLSLAYLAGVFCKESAVVLPGLMLLHDAALPANGSTWRERVRRTSARAWPAYLAVLPGLAMLLWARWAMFHNSPLYGQNGLDNPIVVAGFWAGVMTAVKVMGYYLALVVWPAKLSCDYAFNQITIFAGTFSGQDGHAWLALAALVGIIVGAAVAWRRHRAIAFFLGFAAAAFLPTANLLFPIGVIMAERLMYLPLVGIVAALVLTVTTVGARLLGPKTEPVRRQFGLAAVWVAAAIVVALGVRTMARNEDWTSDERLWSSAAETCPNDFKVYRSLAWSIMEADPSGGRVDEALEMAARSLRIVEHAPVPLHHMPTELYAEAGWYHLRKGELLAQRGDRPAADGDVRQALALLRRGEDIDREINRLARRKLLDRGRPEAEIHDIGSPALYRNLGTAYLVSGDPLQAIAALGYMQRIQPRNFDAHYVRGLAEGAAAQMEQARGKESEAQAHMERAAVNLIAATLLKPDHDPTWQALGRIYAYLAPAPPPVTMAGGVPTLNTANPLVPTHLRLACVQLVRQLREGGLNEDADRWQARMVGELHVPPQAFER